MFLIWDIKSPARVCFDYTQNLLVGEVAALSRGNLLNGKLFALPTFHTCVSFFQNVVRSQIVTSK